MGFMFQIVFLLRMFAEKFEVYTMQSGRKIVVKIAVFVCVCGAEPESVVRCEGKKEIDVRVIEAQRGESRT